MCRLASQGYTVATFDYRGIGASRAGELSGFRAVAVALCGYFRAKFAQALWTTYLIPELS